MKTEQKKYKIDRLKMQTDILTKKKDRQTYVQKDRQTKKTDRNLTLLTKFKDKGTSTGQTANY